MKKMKTLCGLVCLLLCVALCACWSERQAGKPWTSKPLWTKSRARMNFPTSMNVTDNMLMSVYGIDQKDVKSFAGLTERFRYSGHRHHAGGSD